MKSQWEQNQANRVDFSTYLTANSIIFPVSKHFCGSVHCPDGGRVFICNKCSRRSIRRLLYYTVLDNRLKYSFLPKKQVMNFYQFPPSAASTVVVGVKERIHATYIVTNRRIKTVGFSLELSEHGWEICFSVCFCSAFNNLDPHYRQRKGMVRNEKTIHWRVREAIR